MELETSIIIAYNLEYVDIQTLDKNSEKIIEL